MARTPDIFSYPPTLPLRVGETPYRDDVELHARSLRSIAMDRSHDYGIVKEGEDGKKVKMAYLATNYGVDLYLWKITNTDISVDEAGHVVSAGDLSRGLVVEGVTWEPDPRGGNRPVKVADFELPRQFPVGQSKASELIENYNTDELFKASCHLDQSQETDGALYEMAILLVH